MKTPPAARSCALSLALSLGAIGCDTPRFESAGQGHNGVPSVLAEAGSQARLERGRELFIEQCAVCHGAEGLADGPAALQLFPPARDFGRAQFRLVSTENGVPTDGDLVRTLRRGIPGSAMPAWNFLPDEDLYALAAEVRHLAVRGLAQRLVLETSERGSELDLASAMAAAEERLRPGRQIAVGVAAQPSAEVLDRGHQLFRMHCVSCHGPDGKGVLTPRWDEDGTLNWPRDFTAGWLKGDAAHEDLAWRIRAGMPGSPMPATLIPNAQDLAALVAHVQSLIPEGVAECWVQSRQRLIAARTEGSLPTGARDPAWDAAMPIDVVLAPLWKRPDSVHGAELAALHDGERVALRLRWQDATREADPLSDLAYPDGAALQFSRDPNPVLFGMGSVTEPTVIWSWKTVDARDIGEGSSALPHVELNARWTPPERSSPPTTPTHAARVYRASTLENGSPLTEVDEAIVEVCAEWENGTWQVVFQSVLGAGSADWKAGAPLQLSCAVWNGAARDGKGQKAISIWHELELAP